MRDTRIKLEDEGDTTWEVACRMAAVLDGLERDEADAELRSEEAYRRQLQLTEAERRLELDVILLYRLTNGQVDLPGPVLLSAAGRDVTSIRRAPIGIQLGNYAAETGRGPTSSLHNMEGACILRRLGVEQVNEAILDHGSDKVFLTMALIRYNKLLQY